MPRAILRKALGELTGQVEGLARELAEARAQLRAETAARDTAEQQLRSADRRKDEFLATLAHELRNPLAPIRNSLKLLAAPQLDEPKREWGRRVISRQVNRMARLLDDLLDVSRITRGHLELKVESVDLGSLIASAVETANPLIEAKEHTFKTELPAEPLTVEVDPLRVSQALANLLTNAAKYTDPGGRITLAVHLKPTTLTMIVSDTGIGFEKAALPQMFEMFAQVGAAEHRTERGLGIGLALVKSLIHLHGGTVEATSAGLGYGSDFLIHLPSSVIVANPAKATVDVPSTVPSLTRGRVLVTDDNRDSADSLALILELEGYDVAVTYSGHQSIERGRLESPDAVILDIGMADMTGYEVARRIRQEEWGRHVFLIAMTGWGQEEDRERAKAAGFDRHLIKPLDSGELQRLIATFLQERDNAKSGGQGTYRGPGQSW